ncbi:MAG: cytochrome c oxidase subunit II [Alphaproteobacteria bacterium]
MNRVLITVSVLLLAIFAGQASASEPTPWQMGLQPAASPTAAMIVELHDALLIVITVITVFVLGLLIYVSIRFRESRNPTPSTTTHHALLEIAWTVVPVLILTAIAVPSMKLLYFADRIEDGDMTLKVVGHQWYWEYQYPDHGNFGFDANLIPEEELKPGQKRQMDTDNPVVLPVGKKIRLLFASADTIHNWSMSSFGVKVDTTPGRLNETWVQIDRAGTYYGFCSELCGVNHAYMPIMVKAVSPAEFDIWVEKAKQEFARVDEPDAPSKATIKVAEHALSK